jgi:hypothetical protein
MGGVTGPCAGPEKVFRRRRRIHIDRALPMKDDYAQWLRDMMRISRLPAHDRRKKT